MQYSIDKSNRWRWQRPWHRNRHSRYSYRGPSGRGRKRYLAVVALLLLIGVAWQYEGRTSRPITTTKTPVSQQVVRPKLTQPSTVPQKTIKPFGVALGDTAEALSKSQLNQEFSNLTSWGVGWIRIDVSWADVQPNSPNQYDWSGLDQVISAAKSHGLKVLGTLAYAPAWAEPLSCPNDEKCPPASDAQFAGFATAAVKRYAPLGVHDWEIWNEPNLQGFWEPAPNPESYTQMLKAVYPAIKQTDPSATVISGGLGPLDTNPNSINQQTFLADIYADGAQPYFDALGYHPYSYPAPPSYVISWSGWSSMDDIADSIRSIMISNGDGNKPIWITEYGAPTDGPGAEATTTNLNFNVGPDYVSDDLQAEMLTQSYDIYQSSSWLANYFWYSYQDLGTSTSTNENFFGLLNYNGTPKPAVTALERAIASQQ